TAANDGHTQYALKPNPAEWGSAALTMSTPEPDDDLHNPDPRRDLKNDRGGHIFTARGIANLGACSFSLQCSSLYCECLVSFLFALAWLQERWGI
ncbi:hypothetical protein BKA83DRAFT_4070202, partial [Pisolithus microcarpus]